MAEAGEAGRWSDSIRAAPLGVLVLAGLLAVLGGAVVVAGVYQAVSSREVGWFALASALLLGPVALYLALHLVRGARWAWMAALMLLLLLLGSSLVRAAGSRDLPLSPLVELAVEAAAIAYLLRPAVRRRFRGG